MKLCINSIYSIISHLTSVIFQILADILYLIFLFFLFVCISIKDDSVHDEWGWRIISFYFFLWLWEEEAAYRGCSVEQK